MTKEFTGIINSFYSHRAYDVFRDFVRMTAIAISQPFYRDSESEKRYLELIGKYTKEDAEKFPRLFALTVTALQNEHQDFMGNMFMDSAHGNSSMGQFFTPYSISRMMSKIQADDIIAMLEHKEFITVSEPTCGSGGMIVALDEVLKDRDINTAKKIYVHAIDLDPVAADMAYIQLSLLGIPATVLHGDTLRMKFYRELHTPVYFLERWEYKLSRGAEVRPQTNKYANVELYTPEVKEKFLEGVLF